MKKKLIIFMMLLIIILCLAGCVPNDGSYTVLDPAGFWSGLWHGLISFVTFLMGIFTGGKYTIYEAFNNGGWYNFGFLLGVGAFAGGGSIASSKR